MSAGGAAAAIAAGNAIAAAGGIVRLDPEEFLAILDRSEDPLVIYANQWMPFVGRHCYLMSYRGFHFVTRSIEELPLPKGTELIRAKSIFTPV